jgi:hypothetical protein
MLYGHALPTYCTNFSLFHSFAFFLTTIFFKGNLLFCLRCCIHKECIFTESMFHSIGRFYGSGGRDQSRSNNDGFRARSRSPPNKALGVSNW